MPKKEDKYSHDIYKKITHSMRIHIIHQAVTLKRSIREIEAETGIQYTSVRNIILTYHRTGRTNKLTYLRSRELSKKIGKVREKAYPMTLKTIQYDLKPPRETSKAQADLIDVSLIVLRIPYSPTAGISTR